MMHSEISKRELDVLRLIACEFSMVEIAHHLYISAKTAKSHRKKLEEIRI